MSEEAQRPLLREADTEALPRNSSDTLRRLSSSGLQPPYDQYNEDGGTDTPSGVAVWTVIPVLLLGVFVSNADTSLVIASSSRISSGFDSLDNASWLVTSYGLAQCASQTMYGKLSDIFGRKASLAVAYTFFALGCFLCAVGQSYWLVIAGRAISGVGGAGMTALVSIIIADMVPVRKIASWRSYVNIVATVGRSLGGPVGGWLADTVGWRWSFGGQVPLTVLGLLLVLWRIPGKVEEIEAQESFFQRVKRIDVIGAVTLASTISAFLVALDLIAKAAPCYQTLIASLLSFVGAILFYMAESRWAAEPILPIKLLTKRAASTSYLLVGVQIAAQTGMFYTVPIYFQIAANTSVASAGARLIPAVIGNAIGGLLSGFVILKLGHYRLLTICASALALIGYIMVVLRWHGHTTWLETSYFFLGGCGMGIIQSTTFVHLAASLPAADMAIAGTTLYLAQNVFAILGVQLSTTVFRTSLKVLLERNLRTFADMEEIIQKALSSVQAIWDLPERARDIVIEAHLSGMSNAFALSVLFAFIGLILGASIQEGKL